MKIKNTLLLFVLSVLLINCSKDDDAVPPTEGNNTDDEVVLSSENKILAFEITPHTTSFSGNIDHSNKTIEIYTSGLQLNNVLIPQIEISENATISPDPSIAQNFSEAINYTVTAEDGTEAIYTISTINSNFSDEKKILNFQLEIEGEVFEGVIDHSSLTISVETYKNPSNVIPNIAISDNATISPSSTYPQNFLEDVEYTVTAEDQTSNTYVVKTKFFSFLSINAGGTTNIYTKYYKTATPFIRTFQIDLEVPNSQILLENDQNSYVLDILSYQTTTSNGNLITFFKIGFPSDIVTANNYKLVYIVDGELRAQSSFVVDVLAENSPEISSSNQPVYSYNDTLILSGNNLVPGLRVAAHNINIYQYDSSHITVSADGTTLTFPLNVNHNMFPSWTGESEPYPTPISIFYNGRYAETIIVDFL